MSPYLHGPFTAPYGLNIKIFFPTKVSSTREVSIPKKEIEKVKEEGIERFVATSTSKRSP